MIWKCKKHRKLLYPVILVLVITSGLVYIQFCSASHIGSFYVSNPKSGYIMHFVVQLISPNILNISAHNQV